MNIFKLPIAICDEITRVLAQFWWNSNDGKKGMHWFSWKRLCLPKKEGGLGFRDIESFNLALLGKQAWRLLQKPDCLMARVLRGRYYGTGNILTATVKRTSSFAWKSILQGRDLMKRGLRFVVGDGNTIDAWTDPWLPTHPPRAPNPRNDDVRRYLLKDWFNPTRTGWNDDLIKTLVSDEDIHLILSTRICSRATYDMVGWHYTTNGLYTVKSAYWLATHLPEHEVIDPPSGHVTLNNAIWKLQTVPKLKHFLWKVVSGSLPTGEMLRRRHIISESLCLRCCQHDETTNHILFVCPYAQQVWRAIGFVSSNLSDPLISVDTKLETLLLDSVLIESKVLYHTVIWILWRLWTSRNKLVFQRKPIHWRNLVRYGRNDAMEFLNAQETHPDLMQSRLTHTGRLHSGAFSWNRPPPDWIKCNYDGSFHSSNMISCAGWIFWNSNGVYRGAGQCRDEIAKTALEGEFQALLMAMQSAWTHGHRRVIFEGDSKQLVDIVNHVSLNFGLYNWVLDVWFWKSKFDEVLFTWVPRGANRVADVLAKLGMNLSSSSIYHPYDPFMLYDVLHYDYVSSG